MCGSIAALTLRGKAPAALFSALRPALPSALGLDEAHDPIGKIVVRLPDVPLDADVVLVRDVEKLGKADTVVKVKDGFARNFLIPNGLAIPLTPGNLKKLEEEKQRKAQQLDKIKQESSSLKARLEALSLTLPVLTQEGDRLYGSIGG
jgi:hypothetical protein